MAEILLVEPDRQLAAIYRRAFAAAGHHVRHTAMAQQAVELVDAAAPDIIVLELQLPAHNGVEFLYELQSYPEWQHIPIVINTATPPQQLAAAADVLREQLSVRAVHYKPHATLQLLLRSVAEVLGA